MHPCHTHTIFQSLGVIFWVTFTNSNTLLFTNCIVMLLNPCSAGHSISSTIGTLNVTMLWCCIQYQIKTLCDPKINFILCQFLFWYVLL